MWFIRKLGAEELGTTESIYMRVCVRELTGKFTRRSGRGRDRERADVSLPHCQRVAVKKSLVLNRLKAHGEYRGIGFSTQMEQSTGAAQLSTHLNGIQFHLDSRVVNVQEYR